MLIDTSVVQPEKVKSLMEVTEFGMVIDDSTLQFKNVNLRMEETRPRIVSISNLVRNQKTQSPISVTSLGWLLMSVLDNEQTPYTQWP